MDLAPDKAFSYSSSSDDIPFIKLFKSIWFDHPDNKSYRARSGELLDSFEDCDIVPYRHLALFSLLFVEAGVSIIEFLKARLESPDARVCGGAEEMLRAILEEGGVEIPISDRHAFRAAALALLTSKATSADLSTAAPAIRVLRSMFSNLEDGHWGPLESRPYIEMLTRSPDKEIAGMAKACLKKFGRDSWALGG